MTAGDATDDYDSDMQFGIWLKAQRTAVQLTLEQVEEKSGIPAQRIKSLEMGYAEKGINQTECEKIAAVYKVQIKLFLEKAAGGVA